MGSKLKIGKLVEITWLDAVGVSYLEELEDGAFERGGEPVISIGFVCAINKKSVIIVAELDHSRKPLRDYTLIPRSLINSVKFLRHQI